MARPETPHAAVDQVLTGHERRRQSRCWRRHGTPTPLLVHTRSGRGTVGVDGQWDSVPVAAGDTILWLPGAMQDFGPDGDAEPWEIVWAHFHPRDGWHEWSAWPLIGNGIARLPSPPPRLLSRIDEALLEMDSYARSALPRASDFAMNALERALLWLDAANPVPARLDEPVQEAVLFISRHLDRQMSVGEIAAAARLSPSRLAHLFKQQVGVSPARFVEQRRMERAKILLQSSSLPIAAVSEAIGLSSQFYFAVRFKAYTGLPPSDWRRRSRPAAPQHAGRQSRRVRTPRR